MTPLPIASQIFHNNKINKLYHHVKRSLFIRPPPPLRSLKFIHSPRNIKQNLLGQYAQYTLARCKRKTYFMFPEGWSLDKSELYNNFSRFHQKFMMFLDQTTHKFVFFVGTIWRDWPNHSTSSVPLPLLPLEPPFKMVIQ